ncbi:lycopene cyclase domain-containing protein [Mucilaginibacter humi]|nr:lycopene cyclase domain-containing protein [Mucilaginibacter humi]
MFTYTCLSVLIKKKLSKRGQLVITSTLIALSFFMSIRFHALSYTSYTFVVLAILLIIAQFVLKVNWLSQFYTTYLVLLLPFIIVNGLLTGTGLANPVVWYNPLHIIGLRILTIPFEDIFYGMDLILLNVMIYSAINSNIYQRSKTLKQQTTGPL